MLSYKVWVNMNSNLFIYFGIQSEFVKCREPRIHYQTLQRAISNTEICIRRNNVQYHKLKYIHLFLCFECVWIIICMYVKTCQHVSTKYKLFQGLHKIFNTCLGRGMRQLELHEFIALKNQLHKIRIIQLGHTFINCPNPSGQ